MKKFIFVIAALFMVSTNITFADTSKEVLDSSEVSVLSEALDDCENNQAECEARFAKYRAEDEAGIICIDGECMKVSSGH